MLKLRGIMLVITLIGLAMMAMIITAALILSRGSDAVGGSLQEQQAAVLAAEAGLQYARARLQERPNWRGDGDGGTTVATTVQAADGSMVVTEDNGTVIGYMRSPEGLFQQFRFRFNYHDGNVGAPSDADGLDNPAYLVASPWVSVNNLMSGESVPTPRAVLSGGVYRVTPASPMPYDCPRYTADIIVEGYAGPGLREQLSGGIPNPDPPRGNQRVVSRVVEANFRRESAATADSAVYAAQDIQTRLANGGSLLVESMDTSVNPRMRSNGNVAVDPLAGGAVSYNTSASGEVLVRSSTGTFTIDGVNSVSPAATQQTTPKEEFLQLKWSEVKQAVPTDINVRAGTYVWRQGGAPPYAQATPYLEYFPVEWTAAGVFPVGGGSMIMANPADIEMGGSGAINFDGANYRLEVRDNLYVQPQGAVTGLAIIPEDAITLSGFRPATEFDDGGGANPILTSQGNVTFKGEVKGEGAVTAQGDLRFQGSSALTVDPDTSVALYARGDMYLEAIPEPVVASGAGAAATGASTTYTSTTGTGAALGTSPPPVVLQFQDQVIAGIVYTQGNFTADLKGPTYQGSLFIRGILAAYGGDPEAGDAPGANTRGAVRIDAENAQLKFDSAYIDSLIDIYAPATLVQTLYGVL